MHARTLTHCQSHTDTHPHVLTKNCKTDCEKCRMRWVGTIGDAKSILDFVYSMCMCVCVYFVYSVYTRTTLAGAPNYRGLSIETDCRCQLARQYLQAPPCSCSSARAAQQRRQPERERETQTAPLPLPLLLSAYLEARLCSSSLSIFYDIQYFVNTFNQLENT